MGKRYFGGWRPENLPVSPSSGATSIPGVWHIDDVHMLLGEGMTSEIDSAVYIYKRSRGGSYPYISWPRSTFTIDTINDVNLGCKSIVDFEASATKGYAVDFGYDFKFYWEKQTPGSSTWVPEPSPILLTTTKIRLGKTAYTLDNAFRGYLANFRYSSVARYVSAQNPYATTVAVLSAPSFDGNTLALLKFDTAAFPDQANSTPTVPWTSLDPAPTFFSASFSTETTGGLLGTNYTAQTASGYLTLQHSTGFTRNTDDFCAEIYFRTIDDVDWSMNNDPYATLFDMREGTNTTGPKNVDAIALVLSQKNKLQVLRGDQVIIESTTAVNSNTTEPMDSWYHAILNRKDGKLCLYVRPATSQIATLVGESYSGEFISRLRLRNLTSADDGTQFRVRATYGALREAYSQPATLSANAPTITWDGPFFSVDGPDVPNLVGPNALSQGDSFDIYVNVDAGSGFSTNALDYRWEVAGVRTDGTSIEIGDPASILAWTTVAGKTNTSFSGNAYFSGTGNIAFRAVAICGQIATEYSPVAFIQQAQ